MSLELSGTSRFAMLWRNRDLRLLLLAGLVSQTGDWILATGIAFQVYALTGSTLASAAALLASQAPQVVLGSVAGVLVDRWDRRRVMVVVNLLLSVVLIPLFWVQDPGQVWIIVVVVAVNGCLTPFFAAAEVTMLPAVVESEHLVTANAVNAQVRNVSRLVGAALGGLIIAGGGLLWLAVVDIATFLLAALLLSLIRHRPTVTDVQPWRPVRDWVEGLATIRGSRTLLVLVFFFAVSGVGEAVMGTLFAPFVHDVLGGSAGSFGTILAAQAVGGIAGGLVVTAVGHRFAPRTLFAWGAVAFGVGDLALFLYPLLSKEVWPAIVIIALVGVPGAALFAGMLTVFQNGTDERVRGRVYGTLITVQNLAMLLSTYAAGSLAVHVGITAVITTQGAVYVIAGVVVLVALHNDRSADRRPDDDHEIESLFAAPLDNPAISTMLPSMSLASNVRTNTVSDPLALRALAHPVRLELHALVARSGSLTAAEAARELGISHALASHHLRQLAKYGFVEPAETPDHRAHPWRVTSTSLELEPTEPGAQATVDVMDRHFADKAAQQLAQWQDHRSEDPDWADLKPIHPSTAYLTREELDTVIRAWHDTIWPLIENRPIGHHDQRPADTVPVNLTLMTVPLSPTEQGG